MAIFLAKAWKGLAESVPAIHIVPLIRDLEKIERAWFYPDIEGIGATGGLPLQVHFPAVEITPEADRRIGKPVADEIIPKVPYTDGPVLGGVGVLDRDGDCKTGSTHRSGLHLSTRRSGVLAGLAARFEFAAH